MHFQHFSDADQTSNVLKALEGGFWTVEGFHALLLGHGNVPVSTHRVSSCVLESRCSNHNYPVFWNAAMALAMS
jgi:hypothetical protein